MIRAKERAFVCLTSYHDESLEDTEESNDESDENDEDGLSLQDWREETITSIMLSPGAY